jgi:NDP-sugar pyrophosphorylase family protein
MRLRGVLPEGTPKCMADIGGRPFLEILVGFLGHQFPPDRIKLSAGVGWDRIPLKFLVNGTVEPQPLGTGGAVARAALLEHLKLSDPFFVINGDTYCELDYAAILESHFQAGFDVTIPYDHLYRHVGVAVLSKKSIAVASEKCGRKFNLESALAIWPKKKILVNWYAADVRYFDIGTPESLAAFRRFWMEAKDAVSAMRQE